MQTKIEIPLLPYYVYMLCDPMDNKVFYIGKGTNKRGNNHGSNLISAESTERDKIIEELKKKNTKHSVRVVGRFETNQEAFAVESVLIKWVYGINNLVNAIHGHSQKNIRAHDDFSEISGIDIPLILRNSGEFTSREVLLNEKFLIKEKLHELNIIINEKFKFEPETKTEISLLRPKDPSLFIILDNCKIQLLLRNRSNDHIVFNVKMKTGQDENHENLALKLDAQLHGGANERYFKIPGLDYRISLHDTETLMENIASWINAVKTE